MHKSFSWCKLVMKRSTLPYWSTSELECERVVSSTYEQNVYVDKDTAPEMIRMLTSACLYKL